MAQITIHGKRRGRAVDHDWFTETGKETDCASKSKFMWNPHVMRKIKRLYFPSVSQINEAKSLINNVFSPCNYAAVIATQHCAPVSVQA